jgi:hypothetical protein
MALGHSVHEIDDFVRAAAFGLGHQKPAANGQGSTDAEEGQKSVRTEARSKRWKAEAHREVGKPVVDCIHISAHECQIGEDNKKDSERK